MSAVHDDGSVNVLYHDVRILWPVGNVIYRLPDAEQQSHDQDSEHTDNYVQPLLWRECIKPCPDASRNSLFCLFHERGLASCVLHFFTVLMSLFSIIVKFRIWKPLGLSSERLEFISRHSVTSVLSVMLLSRMMVCLANVLT